MALLMLVVLLLVLDLVLWRGGTTPATAATGDPDNSAGAAGMAGGGGGGGGRSGRVVGGDLFYDQVSLLMQLGLMP